MKSEIDVIKSGFKSIPRGLLDFFKKILVFSFLYGRLFAVVAALSIFIMQILRVFGVPLDICILIAKLFIIIGQIIPAASYVGAINEDQNIEGSTDICFSGWIILSLLIWYL